MHIRTHALQCTCTHTHTQTGSFCFIFAAANPLLAIPGLLRLLGFVGTWGSFYVTYQMILLTDFYWFTVMTALRASVNLRIHQDLVCVRVAACPAPFRGFSIPCLHLANDV